MDGRSTINRPKITVMKKPKDELRAGYMREDFASLQRGQFHQEAVALCRSVWNLTSHAPMH